MQLNMACCGWMRSKNDSLLDPTTRTRYCGTCWQRWFVARTATLSQKAETWRASSDELVALTQSSANASGIVEENRALGKLECFTAKDQKVYLISRKRNLAFDIEKTSDGNLQCVGELAFDRSEVSIKMYNVKSVARTISFPFPTSPEDHCETPFVAYQELAPYLQYYGKLIGKSRRSLKIWDPFYCNGAVKQNFVRLGFVNVYNECEDFYTVLRNGNLPEHDCIVTNPPYSTAPTDHVQELLKYLCSQTKPWFVLQPNYVYTKPFWEELTSTVLQAPRPFFLTPTSPRKYKYQTPSGIRQVASSKKLKTSPFVSMWYCWLEDKYLARMIQWIATKHARAPLPLSLACCEFFLPDSFKDSTDRSRRKRRKLSQATIPEIKNAVLSPKSPQSHKTKHIKRTPTRGHEQSTKPNE